MRLAAALGLASATVLALELTLTRVFSVVLFASFAHLAIALALSGIGLGAALAGRWRARDDDDVAAYVIAIGPSAIVAMMAACWLPWTTPSATPPTGYGDRSTVAWDLLDPVTMAAAMPLLAAPFVAAGASFASAFALRADRIGPLYAADLVGAALGALSLAGLLQIWSVPDVVWPLAALCGGIGWLLATRRRLRRAGAVLGLVALALAIVANRSQGGLIRVHVAAGFAEERVTDLLWTPLTRVGLHVTDDATTVVLDNASASEVPVTQAVVERLDQEPNRGLVYRLHPEGARVAVLGASAGPEVAVALVRGAAHVDAVDIVGEIGPLLSARFAGTPADWAADPRVRSIVLDGRAAMRHANPPYDIIHMVHANLHGAAGLLASAWTSHWLETVEAFEDHFAALAPGGTLSFARGTKTSAMSRAAAEALRRRGVKDPGAHIVAIDGPASFFLARNEAFSASDLARIRALTAGFGGARLAWDPHDTGAQARATWIDGPGVMTDDRPFAETPGEALAALGQAVRALAFGAGDVPAVTLVFHALVAQLCATFAFGLVLAALAPPSTNHRRRDTLFAIATGYGFIALETNLAHELALGVGHPARALALTLGVLLASSGVGALASSSVSNPARTLRKGLLATIGTGAIVAWVGPLAWADAPSVEVRMLVWGASLVPVGLAMGVIWPSFIALRRESDPVAIPWLWGVSIWAGVAATGLTLGMARVLGYDAATLLALTAYAVAWWVAPTPRG